MSRLFWGVRRPNTEPAATTSPSSRASVGSALPSVAAAPSAMPARAATAATVTGESPENTFSAMPRAFRNSTVSTASDRSRSSNTTSASGVTRGGVASAVGSGTASVQPNASTRRPAASSLDAAPSGIPSTSGAPSTSQSSASLLRAALHFQRDENGTCPAGSHAAAWGSAAAIASTVAFRAETLLANPPRSLRTSGSSSPGTAMTACSASAPSVRVPVLSRQTVSTFASDSTEFRYCTSSPWWVRRIAAAAKVMLVRRISPSGTSVTMPAVATPAASRNDRWWRIRT